MLLSMGLQQVGHDLVIEQLYIYIYIYVYIYIYIYTHTYLVSITSCLGDIKEVT